ncbi:MAG: M56 family metallopeptidase, partial [Planctomycetota bacterium]
MSAALGHDAWGTALTCVAGWLMNALLFGTIAAGLTWLLLATALRRARPFVHGAFWVIVLAKFLIPVGPTFAFSLPTMLSGWLSIPASIVEPPAETVRVYAVFESSQKAPGASNGALPAPASPPEPPIAAELRVQPAAVSWYALAVAAYLIGVGVVLAVRLTSYVRFVRRSRRLPLAGRGMRRLVAAVCRTSGVSRPPTVRMSDDSQAPYVFGLFRPTLVMSRRRALDHGELEAVLFHEIAHLRRLDMAIRYLQWLAGTILFFWPVVAWVNRRINLARELACDEWALRHGRLRPGQYARCLLRAMQPGPPMSAAYRPAAMAANISHVERRIEMIMNHRGRGRTRRSWAMLAGAGVLAWSSFVLTGAAAVEERPQDEAAAEDAQVQHLVFQSDDGKTHEFTVQAIAIADGDSPAAFAGDGSAMTFFATSDLVATGDGAFVHFSREISPESLEQFRIEHPGADADSDGVVTMEEHDAYLVALAMSAPQAVLAEYPQADADEDGVLSVEEAAQFVTSTPQVADAHVLLEPSGAAQPVALSSVDAGNVSIAVAAADADGAMAALPMISTGDSGEMLVEIVTDADGAALAGSSPVITWKTADVDVESDGATSTRRIKLRATTDDGSEIELEKIDDGAPRVMAVLPDGKIVEGDAIPAELQDKVAELQSQLDDAGGQVARVIG